MPSFYSLSEIQAKAILEMQLQRLTGLERQKILTELAEVQSAITRLSAILSSEKVLLDVIGRAARGEDALRRSAAHRDPGRGRAILGPRT